MNILQLPDELLESILSYIPNHLELALTCKKFHDISCNIKLFKLEIHDYSEDDEHFESMMNSQRRIDDLEVSAADLNNNHLSKLLQHFGKDVKHVKFSSNRLPSNIIELLNLMPKLEKISLHLMKTDGSFFRSNLNLRKLKTVECVL